MALTHQVKQMELVDVQIASMTSDTGTTPVYGALVDIPGAIKVTATPKVESKRLEGDSKLLDVFTRITEYELEVEHGILSLDALAILQGGAVADSGTTPSQKATYSLTSANVKAGYWKLEGKWNHAGVGVGDVHVILYKCVMTDPPSIEAPSASEDYGKPKFKAVAFATDSNDKWLDIVVNETATAIA